MLRTRQESLEKGVLVDETQWQALLEMNKTGQTKFGEINDVTSRDYRLWRN